MMTYLPIQEQETVKEVKAFHLPASEISALFSENTPAPGQPLPSPSNGHQTAIKVAVFALGVLLLLAGVVFWAFGPNPKTEGAMDIVRSTGSSETMPEGDVQPEDSEFDDDSAGYKNNPY